MAIGDYGRNNNGSSNGGYQKQSDPTYYSRLRFKSNNTNNQLSISFRSGLMIVEIGKLDAGFKFVSDGTIYLSPIKAYMLANQIDEMLKYRNEDEIDANKAFGVNAGIGETTTYIGLSTNDSKAVRVIIGKFNSDGAIIESTSFEFNADYNYALEWNNIESNDLVKVYDNNAEIIMFRNAVKDFARSASGSYGYSAADIARFDNKRIERKFDDIFDKLGIERRSYNGNTSYNNGGNNFLNNASSNSKSTSIDEISENLLV